MSSSMSQEWYFRLSDHGRVVSITGYPRRLLQCRMCRHVVRTPDFTTAEAAGARFAEPGVVVEAGRTISFSLRGFQTVVPLARTLVAVHGQTTVGIDVSSFRLIEAGRRKTISLRSSAGLPVFRRCSR